MQNIFYFKNRLIDENMILKNACTRNQVEFKQEKVH